MRKVATFGLLFSLVTLGICNEWLLARTNGMFVDLLAHPESYVTKAAREYKNTYSLAALWDILYSPIGLLVLIGIGFFCIESYVPTMQRRSVLLWREIKTPTTIETWVNSKAHVDAADERIGDGINFFTQMCVEVAILLWRALIMFFTFGYALWNLGWYYSDTSGFLLWFLLPYCLMQDYTSWRISGGILLKLQDSNRNNESATRNSLIHIEKLKKNGASRWELQDAGRQALHAFTNMQKGYLETLPRNLFFDTWNNSHKQIWATIPIICLALAYWARVDGSLLTPGIVVQTAVTLGMTHGALSFSPEVWVKVNLIRTHYLRLKKLDAQIAASPSALGALVPQTAKP